MKKKYLVLTFIIIFIKANNIIEASETSNSSSSSSSLSSSTLNSTSSPATSLSSMRASSSSNSDVTGVGKKIVLTPLQQKTLEQLKTVKEINNFPPGIPELICLYSEPFNEKATEDLRNAIFWRNVTEEKTTMIRIEEALHNNADINCNVYKFINLDHTSPLLLLTDDLRKRNIDKDADWAFYLTKKLLEYPNIDVNIQRKEINERTKKREFIFTPLSNTIIAFINDLQGDRASESRSTELIEIIELLLKKGANINIFHEIVDNNNAQITPLIELVKRTYINGIDFNIIDNLKYMQLLAQVFNLLLDHGADPSIGYDLKGNTFIDIIGNLFQEYPEIMYQTMRGVCEKAIKIINAKSTNSSSSSSSSSS